MGRQGRHLLTTREARGGTGGLVAARRLRRRLDPADRVVVVGRDATFRFAPSCLWVMTGARRPAQISADRRRLRRSGRHWRAAKVGFEKYWLRRWT